MLVYIPNTISLVYLQKWRLRSFATFVEAFVEQNTGRTTWAHARDKVENEPWLTNESQVVYDSATNLLYQMISILLSTVFNVAVIAVAVDQGIVFWYLAAAVVLFAANFIFQKLITAASLKVQTARNGLSQTMLLAWENILIGNSHNLSRWQGLFNSGVAHTAKAAVSYDVTRSLISSATVSVAMVLIAVGNGIFLVHNQANTALVAALLVTFPRQLQIVQNIFAFFNVHLSWAGVAQQLERLAGLVTLTVADRNVHKYVQIGDIILSNGGEEKTFSKTDDFLNQISLESTGRFTLRGRNGSGKSTLISLLKEVTGAASFYLPAKFSELQFADSATVKESDGKRLVAVIRELETLSGVKYIFLDEWDANLDGDNLKIIDAAIETLSQSRVVVEARHRNA